MLLTADLFPVISCFFWGVGGGFDEIGCWPVSYLVEASRMGSRQEANYFRGRCREAKINGAALGFPGVFPEQLVLSLDMGSPYLLVVPMGSIGHWSSKFRLDCHFWSPTCVRLSLRALYAASSRPPPSQASNNPSVAFCLSIGSP